MNKKKFFQIIQKTYQKIEKKIEKKFLNYDIEIIQHENILTIEFSNLKKIIFTTQQYLNQLWMATYKQGYHFEYNKNLWRCIRTKKKLFKILNFICLYYTQKKK
ncbi:Protein CyaY [Buchnera aphidicola (Tuberolachnus salignus)]|uniref:Protein CyaY n=1 Tax=Buchnera aphidicola subsp. Tuberolachnus salignus TaxID=98804 RepID=A0A160SW74_BUCTT|nr:iron donor protein CyaY [Buchnera aphidicola]CUR53357.1 Protein CyaY [Buchnera aphidicola (Tuberolachnus salignus)]